VSLKLQPVVVVAKAVSGIASSVEEAKRRQEAGRHRWAFPAGVVQVRGFGSNHTGGLSCIDALYGYTKSFDNGNTAYLGNSVRGNALPATPNDEINTSDGRHEYTRQNVKLAGSWNAPWWGISFSPMLRYQQGFPFGRTFATPSATNQPNALSYGSVRILAEPLGTRRQDNIVITDLRFEKSIALRRGSDVSRRDVSLFFDVYNLFNANPEQNLQWSSGTAFNRPLSIVPPRLARIGVKVNF
jgi:hypothetical protein